MTIRVQDGKTKFLIPLPTCLIFSRFSLWAVKKGMARSGEYMPDGVSVDTSSMLVGLTPKKMREIRRTVRQVKRIHRGLCIVEVLDGDTYVKIKM